MSEKVTLQGYVIAPKSDLSGVLQALPEHIRLTRAEPGCIVFRVEQDTTNPLRFSVYEEFESRAAFEAHQARIVGTNWEKASKNLTKFYELST